MTIRVTIYEIRPSEHKIRAWSDDFQPKGSQAEAIRKIAEFVKTL